jgi:hypothetical protein
MAKWHRVRAGIYESADGTLRIQAVCHEGVGPKGGNATLWELALPDSYHGWCLMYPLGLTLREAKAQMGDP